MTGPTRTRAAAVLTAHSLLILTALVVFSAEAARAARAVQPPPLRAVQPAPLRAVQPAPLRAVQPAPLGAGSIEGRVVLPARPARAAERYASGASAERPVQTVPAVVYLQGPGLPAAAAGQSRPRMAQRDTSFVPAALVVTAGSQVEFPNQDPFFHNVFSYSKPKRFDLGRYPRGEMKIVQFDEPGVVKIYCEVHKAMRSLVVVVTSPYHAVADANGRFTLVDVAPGRHELVVVTADRGNKTVAVEVRDGETSSVTVTF